MLRFEAEWVERGAPFTDRRRFALQYYLADDTVEVLDKTSPFSRGGQFSKFLQRQRLPRVPVDVAEAACVPSVTGPTRALGGTSLPPPNAAAIQSAAAAARLRYTPSKGPSTRGKTQNPITGAQVYSPKSPGGGPASVSGIPVLTSEGTAPFVTAADLVCGGIISVYGRPLLLKTCDPYTVAFCLLRLGFDQRHTFLADQVSAGEGASAVRRDSDALCFVLRCRSPPASYAPSCSPGDLMAVVSAACRCRLTRVPWPSGARKRRATMRTASSLTTSQVETGRGGSSSGARHCALMRGWTPLLSGPMTLADASPLRFISRIQASPSARSSQLARAAHLRLLSAS